MVERSHTAEKEKTSLVWSASSSLATTTTAAHQREFLLLLLLLWRPSALIDSINTLASHVVDHEGCALQKKKTENRERKITQSSNADDEQPLVVAATVLLVQHECLIETNRLRTMVRAAQPHSHTHR